MTAIEQQIEELGAWAAGLELSAQDPDTPYWMRQQDAERAKRIREEQLALIERQNMLCSGLSKCAAFNCTTMVSGSAYCLRCEEELTGKPYPLSNILLGETILAHIWRAIRSVFHG